MTHLRTIAAGVVAVTVGGGFVLILHATSQGIGPTENVIICADSAGTLRARAARAGCVTGETPLTVMATHSPPAPTADGLDLPDWPSGGGTDAPKGASVADLEKRVERIHQNRPFFTVVDIDGSKIFQVGRTFADLYEHGSHVSVAALSALDEGGLLAVRSTDGSRIMKAGAVGAKAGLVATWDGVPRIVLSRAVGGNYALKVRALGGEKVLAGIGESVAGTGAIVVGTRTGEPRASLTVDQGRGAVTIFDEGGAAVASLRQAEEGPGFLSLGKAVEAVKMVVNGGYGAVLAGPVLGFPYVPASGIPGSYLLGCSGGPSCHPQ